MTPTNIIHWLLNPPDSAPRSAILIRLMAGGVFLWEGILKFVYVNQGLGRFTRLGIPVPEVMAPFVARSGSGRSCTRSAPSMRRS